MCILSCLSTAKESTLHLVLRLRGGVIEPSLAEPRLMRSTVFRQRSSPTQKVETSATVWEGRMNHKRKVNYCSFILFYFVLYIWMCQGACPKVQLREDDLPQVLCSPPCSLDQASQYLLQCVCALHFVCSHFPLKFPMQMTSTSCC